MKRRKSIATLFLASAIVLTALPLSASAQKVSTPSVIATVSTASQASDSSTTNDVHQLISTAPSSSEIVPYGTSAPSGTAYDLGVSPYNYQVQEIGYQLFTDKLLTNASKMQVSVLNWTFLNGPINYIYLTVDLYSSDGVYQTGITLDMNQYSSGAYVTFSNLSASKKYYVRFGVTNNGYKYAFNGTISKLQ